MQERFYYRKMEKGITLGIGDQSQLQASFIDQYFDE
jgi:hypothetical protein